MIAPRIGNTLREARLAQEIELGEVEQATKIRARFLRAIENEEWDVLPGHAYVRGFLRTYAEYLGLDPDPLLELLERQSQPAADEIPPEPVVRRGTLPSGILRRVRPGPLVVLGAVALVVVLLVLGITAGDGDEEAAAPSPAAEEEAEEAEPPPPEPERATVRLAAVGEVWVCLETAGGERLVDSEILAPGEGRGPFEARRMLMTFGNGQIELVADGREVEVPEAAEPLGYEVSADGVEELEPAERPTCT
jgi:cytoskeleton protein RodZ